MSGKVHIELNQGIPEWFNNKVSHDYFDLKIKELEVENRAQDIAMRKEYAGLIFRFVCYYMVFVLILLFLSGTP